MTHFIDFFQKRPLLQRVVLGLGLVVVLLALDLCQRAAEPTPSRAVWSISEPALGAVKLTLQSQGRIPMPPDTPAAHASTLLAMPPGHPAALMAFWFAGSRESAPDVQIVASQFERATQQWRATRLVVDRQQDRDRLGFAVRRLGNPVAWRDAQGRIHLFVVATGLGGWAAGRILHLRQLDGSQDFSKLSFRAVGALPLSWLWKTSHLVRAMPLPLADGGMVLPVYFELGVKYPVALRFDANGEFRGMVRISQRGHLLQPTLVARSETHWLALMRDNSGERKIKAAQTHDAGAHWSDLADLPLHNPDASVAALALQPDLMVLAHNSLVASRGVLDLSVSPDGLNWETSQTIARGEESSEFSYPALTWADNSLWVSYTEQRHSIAWRRFAVKPNSLAKKP